MDTIEKRARALLVTEYKARGELVHAMNIERGGLSVMYAAEIAAIIAALTPPEGYVLVQESQLRHLLNDAITSVEFIAGRGQSKPLSRRVRDQAWALVKLIPARRRMP